MGTVISYVLLGVSVLTLSALVLMTVARLVYGSTICFRPSTVHSWSRTKSISLRISETVSIGEQSSRVRRCVMTVNGPKWDRLDTTGPVKLFASVNSEHFTGICYSTED